MQITYETRESSLEEIGSGLFSKEVILPGTLVWRYTAGVNVRVYDGDAAARHLEKFDTLQGAQNFLGKYVFVYVVVISYQHVVAQQTCFCIIYLFLSTMNDSEKLHPLLPICSNTLEIRNIEQHSHFPSLHSFIEMLCLVLFELHHITSRISTHFVTSLLPSPQI